jgi:hypothetical protein
VEGITRAPVETVPRRPEAERTIATESMLHEIGVRAIVPLKGDP